MRISRRQLLLLSGTFLVSLVTGYGLKRRRIPKQEIPYIDILCEVTSILIAMPIPIGQYREYFQWRFNNVAKAKDLYQGYVHYLYHLADRFHHRSFDKCTAEEKTVIVSLPGGPELGSGLKKKVHAEIWKRYAATDAWIHLGYPSHPGQPRLFKKPSTKSF